MHQESRQRQFLQSGFHERSRSHFRIVTSSDDGDEPVFRSIAWESSLAPESDDPPRSISAWQYLLFAVRHVIGVFLSGRGTRISSQSVDQSLPLATPEILPFRKSSRKAA
jgi:hypothetical protein